MKVAIVGAGIHGLCTAKALSQRGHGVTVFEQHRPGNQFGSTAGRSRIVRQAYPDQFYTEILLKGHELWHDLESEAGGPLIHEVGLLFVGQQNGEEVLHELSALENLAVEHEVLTQKDVRKVHSHMVLDSDELAVLTKRAGWADVPLVLKSLQRIATSQGAAFVRQRVTNLSELKSQGFDRVVVTAGAWITKFFEVPLTVSLQTFAYVDQAMQGPVWIEGFGDHLYGLPSESGAATAKIGYHTLGPTVDPDNPDREPQPEALAAIRECAARRFGLPDTDEVIKESSCCLYTTAPNEDFKIGWPDDGVLVASPCSGHGFKFGPWMGQLLADILEEKQSLADWPRFSF